MTNKSARPTPVRLQELLLDLGLCDEEATKSAHKFVGLLRTFIPKEPPPLSLFEFTTSGPVQVEKIPYYSICAHHLVPFFGEVSICYEPASKIAGLGGFSKTVTAFAKRPQLQEQMAEQIADFLFAEIEPKYLLVTVSARQMCLELRNQAYGTEVTVNATRGTSSTKLNPNGSGCCD